MMLTVASEEGTHKGQMEGPMHGIASCTYKEKSSNYS